MKKEALVNGQMSNILGLLMILNKLQLILPMVTTWVCKLLDKKAEKKILVSSLHSDFDFAVKAAGAGEPDYGVVAAVPKN